MSSFLFSISLFNFDESHMFEFEEIFLKEDWLQYIDFKNKYKNDDKIENHVNREGEMNGKLLQFYLSKVFQKKGFKESLSLISSLFDHFTTLIDVSLIKLSYNFLLVPLKLLILEINITYW